MRERQAHRAATTLREITDLTGEDHLISRLGSDSELEALFIEGVEAAVRIGLEAKRRLLSRVVAQAVNDEARVDERALLVLALRDLEAPSIRALQRIRVVEDEAARWRHSGALPRTPRRPPGDERGVAGAGPGLCGPDAHRCPGAGRGGVRVPVTGSQDLSPRPAVAERPAGCRHRFSGARAGTRP